MLFYCFYKECWCCYAEIKVVKLLCPRTIKKKNIDSVTRIKGK